MRQNATHFSLQAAAELAKQYQHAPQVSDTKCPTPWGAWYFWGVGCSLCRTTVVALAEREHSRLLLHEDWATDPHLMVVARRHVENISDLDESEAKDFLSLWREAERAVLSVTGNQKSINLKLGLMTPHLHVHIYPFGSDATRDVVFSAFDGKRSSERSEAERSELCEKISEALQATSS